MIIITIIAMMMKIIVIITIIGRERKTIMIITMLIIKVIITIKIKWSQTN